MSSSVATILSLKVAAPAALMSSVKAVISAPPSVPLKIISASLAWLSIVMFPEVVAMDTAASPVCKSSTAPAPIYVFNLDNAAFLFVPPAPSSIIIKSASTRFAPTSVPPSISKSAIAIEPSGNTGVCENVTAPPEDIAIASVSEADPMLPASGITILPPVVIKPPPV